MSEIGAIDQPQKEKHKCIRCIKEISESASVCSHCRSFQDWRHHVPVGSALISFIMLAISFYNLHTSNQKRIEAERLLQNVQNLSLEVTKISWFQISTKNQFGTEAAQIAQQEILKSINVLIPFALPNKDDRDKWIEAFNKKLPEGFRLIDR